MVTSWDRECGIHFYTRPLVDELRKLGQTVHVVCHTDALPSEFVHPVIELARADWFEAVEEEIEAINPDVIHLQFEYGLYSHHKRGEHFSYSAADAFGVNELLFRWKVAGRPAVVTMHSDNTDRPDRLAYIKTMGELASITLVHTEHTALPSGKVAFMPHSAPAARKVKPAKEDYGWQGKKVVGMIGYPDWYKRYDKVVRLWPDIVRGIKEPALLVVACAPRPGSKEGILLGDALNGLVQSSPAHDSIVYLPRLFSQEEFLRVVASFDALVLPYQSAAASGPAMAACAVGTPVVVSSVGGLRSYVEESNAGLAVPVDSDAGLVRAIVRLMNDDSLRKQLADMARRYSRRVSVTGIARKHLTFYRWAAAHTRPMDGEEQAVAS